MTDFFELLIIPIALIVLIGRGIFKALKKNDPPAAKEESAVPLLHFEIEAAKAPPAPLPAKMPKQKKQRQAVAAKKEVAAPAPEAPPPPVIKMPIKPVSAGQADFSLILSRLSPMQQAVVLSEVLGPPKGASQ